MSIVTTVNNAMQTTIDSIESMVKVYKTENKREDDYGVGYDDAMDQILRTLKMYTKIVKDQQDKAELSE
jgi:hypothetical protein